MNREIRLLSLALQGADLIINGTYNAEDRELTSALLSEARRVQEREKFKSLCRSLGIDYVCK